MSLLGEQLNPGGPDQELALRSSRQYLPFYRLHLRHIDVLGLLIFFFNSTLYFIHFYHHLNEQLDSSANINTVLLNALSNVACIPGTKAFFIEPFAFVRKGDYEGLEIAKSSFHRNKIFFLIKSKVEGELKRE